MTGGASPEDVLRAFWTEMHLCEWDAYQTMPSPAFSPEDVLRAHWERCGAEAAAIFDTYCTPKKRVYHQGLYRSIGSPPQYDPETTAIVDVTYESPRRAVIATRPTAGLHTAYSYVLLKRGDKWLIDSRHFYDVDGKLVRVPL